MEKIDISHIQNKSKKYKNIDKVPTNRQIKSDLKDFSFAFLDDYDDLNKLSYENIKNDLTKSKYSFDDLMKSAIKSDYDKCLVALCEDEIVAVCIFSLLNNNPHLTEKLNKLEASKSVQIKFIFVEKDNRGYLLSQRLLAIQEVYSLDKGCTIGVLSVKNTNYHMVKSALKQSYIIVALDEDSFIMICPLGKQIEEVVEQYSVKNLDMKWQQDVLDLGFVGMKLINYKSDDNFFASYSKAYFH